MTTIMVTGGCGFIGSCFIRKILSTRNDTSIICVDKFTYAGNAWNLESFWHDKHLDIVQVDVASYKDVNTLFEGNRVDIIVHFAAETHVDRSIQDENPFIQANVVGTHVIIDAARKHGVKRFVQVSTDEVYGSLDHGQPAFTETSPLKPSNPYAATKAAADMLVAAAHHTHGLPAVITRCSNVYGPFQFPEKLIPVAILNTLRDKPVPIYGNGLNIRDWIFVEDHVEGIIAAMDNGVPGEVYNFGGGTPMLNLDVVKSIFKVMQKKTELISFVPDRPGHDLKYAMDFRKATVALGWYPRVPFLDGLGKTVRWYSEHDSWVKDITTGSYKNGYKEYLRVR